MIKIVSIQIIFSEISIMRFVHLYNIFIFSLFNVCILFDRLKYKFVKPFFIARIEFPSIQP